MISSSEEHDAVAISDLLLPGGVIAVDSVLTSFIFVTVYCGNTRDTISQ